MAKTGLARAMGRQYVRRPASRQTPVQRLTVQRQLQAVLDRISGTTASGRARIVRRQTAALARRRRRV